MKPIKLKMQAFGSYGAETVIDFTKPSQNLFLITGDTGAGKSTIFDAIVFALYGQASAADNTKKGIDLQSQFVSRRITPYVELTFSERRGGEEQIYRVLRRPSHLSPKGRGTGDKEKQEEVELYRPDGTKAVDAVGKNQKESNPVNREIAEIVGLTKAQFMQVAMIAQGDFIKLIRTETKERKPIFRKIFNTEIYDQILTVLSDRNKELASLIKQIQKDIQKEISKVVIPVDYTDAAALDSMKSRILANDKWTIVDLEEFMPAYSQLCAYLSNMFSEASEKKKQAEKKRDDARVQYTKAETLLKSYSQLEEAQKILLSCTEQEEEMKAKDKLKTDIQRAYEIKSLYDQLLKAKKALSDSEAELKKLQDTLPNLKEKEADTEKAKVIASEAYSQKKDAHTRVSESVKKNIALFAKLKEALQTETERKKQKEAAAALLEKEEQAQVSFEKQLQAWQEEHDKLQGTEANLAKLLHEQDKLEHVRVYLKLAEKAKAAHKRQQKAAESAQTEYTEACTEFEQLNEEYQTMSKAFFDEQAGLLATRLEDGKPCPVCGSLTHPNPCQVNEDHQDLSRETIDQKRSEMETAEQKRNETAAASSTAIGLLKEKEAQLQLQIEALTEALKQAEIFHTEPIQMEQIQEHLSTRIQQVSERRNELEQSQKRLVQLEQHIKNAAKTSFEIQEKLSAAKKKLEEAQTQFLAAQIKRSELEKQTEYPSEEEARQVLQQSKSELSELEVALKEAEERYNAAKSKREAACIKIQTLADQTIPKNRADITELDAGYLEVSKEYDLSEAEWQGIVLYHKKEKQEQLEKELAEYRALKSRAEGMAASAKAAVGNQAKPDAQALKAIKEQLESTYNQAEELLQQISDWYKNDTAILEELVSQTNQQKAKMLRYNRLKRLHDKLSGKESGEKIDIETMVQRIYLERILKAANRRFLEMTYGEFELHLMDQSKSTSKDRGLDLMVYSTDTQTEREVKMLSGGESFKAALALALGMSEQIQQNSATVNLDIMFIDEGFGSLDALSRNQAIKVMKELAGGSKLIGIISHVTELKQQIDDKLVVERDRAGSHVHWAES